MSSTLRALLVQTDRDDREMYSEFFRFHDCQTICVSSARDALSLAPIVDVIITGIRLRGDIDGVEFISRLKAEERTRRIPVIVLTTYAWEAQRERAEKAGCDVFLVKPCLPDDLMREVRGAVVLRRAAQPPARTPPARTFRH
jgi:CheY-like chemotaxis protein